MTFKSLLITAAVTKKNFNFFNHSKSLAVMVQEGGIV